MPGSLVFVICVCNPARSYFSNCNLLSFAQPLVCKLLSVNQATNYTAAAAEWHLDLRASWEVKKNHMKSGVVAEADFFSSLWNILDLFPRWLTDKQKTEKEQKTEKRLPVPIGQSKTAETGHSNNNGDTWYFRWITTDTSLQLRGHGDVKAAGATSRL